jgi:hypothetical protein
MSKLVKSFNACFSGEPQAPYYIEHNEFTWICGQDHYVTQYGGCGSHRADYASDFVQALLTKAPELYAATEFLYDALVKNAVPHQDILDEIQELLISIRQLGA